MANRFSSLYKQGSEIPPGCCVKGDLPPTTPFIPPSSLPHPHILPCFCPLWCHTLLLTKLLFLLSLSFPLPARLTENFTTFPYLKRDSFCLLKITKQGSCHFYSAVMTFLSFGLNLYQLAHCAAFSLFFFFMSPWHLNYSGGALWNSLRIKKSKVIFASTDVSVCGGRSRMFIIFTRVLNLCNSLINVVRSALCVIYLAVYWTKGNRNDCSMIEQEFRRWMSIWMWEIESTAQSQTCFLAVPMVPSGSLVNHPATSLPMLHLHMKWLSYKSH